MDMEAIYRGPGVSPGVWAQNTPVNKQDFRYGAKAISAHCPATLASSKDFIREEGAGFGQFYPLSNEFIENGEFSAESLFPELELPSFDADLSSVLDSPGALSECSLLSDSTLKFDSFFSSESNTTTPNQLNPSVAQLSHLGKAEYEDFEIGSLLGLNESLFKIEQENESKESIRISESPCTLKDIMDSNDADVIINSYLLPERPSTPETNHTINEDYLIDWDNDSSSVEANSSYSPLSSSVEYSDGEDCDQRSAQPRRRTREKRSPEVRYLRKKEQNKIAARRYRLKKKVEEEQLVNVLASEDDRYAVLTRKSASLKQELSFVKKILREILVSKKLVPPNTFRPNRSLK